MAYHPFEKIISLWLQRVKGHYILENYPLRYYREKTSKYSPSTATTDFDLISYDIKDPHKINVYECKSNINQTFHNKSRDRLMKQLKDINKNIKLIPFVTKETKVQRHVYGIKIAERIKKNIPKDVNVIDGETLERNVFDELIMHIAYDSKIDPKDDVMSIIRLFWHFGLLNEKYYKKIAIDIIENNNKISANNLRKQLGLISYKTNYCKKLIKEIREDQNRTKRKNGL